MKTTILIVAIGPGNPSLLSLRSSDLLLHAGKLFLRTEQHRIAEWLRNKGVHFTSFDSLYETAENFEDLYREISSRLWSEASLNNTVVYAVPDPSSDVSVDYLFQTKPNEDAEVVIEPGIGLSDLYISLIRSELNENNIRRVSASAFSARGYNPSFDLLITEISSLQLISNMKLLLSDLREDDDQVFLFYADSDGTVRYRKLPLWQIDHYSPYNHFSALAVPGKDFLSRRRFTLDDLDAIMDRLRAPNGCPWDRQQTHESLRPYLVEEAWESVDAIEEQDSDHLADELGDVLLQIVFHASIGKTFDEFNLTDVISNICQKMIMRHPHVFASKKMETAEQVSDIWESLKRKETGKNTIADSLNDVSSALPSLKYAGKIQKKIQQLPGFVRDPSEILGNMEQVIRALLPQGKKSESALGLLLFLCAELGQRLQADGEIALHYTVKQFITTFQSLEKSGISENDSSRLTAENLLQIMQKSSYDKSNKTE